MAKKNLKKIKKKIKFFHHMTLKQVSKIRMSFKAWKNPVIWAQSQQNPKKVHKI